MSYTEGKIVNGNRTSPPFEAMLVMKDGKIAGAGKIQPPFKHTGKATFGSITFQTKLLYLFVDLRLVYYEEVARSLAMPP